MQVRQQHLHFGAATLKWSAAQTHMHTATTQQPQRSQEQQMMYTAGHAHTPPLLVKDIRCASTPAVSTVITTQPPKSTPPTRTSACVLHTSTFCMQAHSARLPESTECKHCMHSTVCMRMHSACNKSHVSSQKDNSCHDGMLLSAETPFCMPHSLRVCCTPKECALPGF
jgi:hypothetical protein